MRIEVSVLMAVHNGAQWVRSAVESILTQSLSCLELVVVDDGSTDSTWSILDQIRDPRLRLSRNQENLGLARCLNHGLSQASGQYIARMDADDIAEPHRLQAQVAYLASHQDVGIVGSACTLIDGAGCPCGLHVPPLTDLEIRWVSLLNNPFVHPSVMLRVDVLSDHSLRYDEAYRTAQDYELWTRLLEHTHGANLETPLLKYRLAGGITTSHRREQLANHDTTACRTIRSWLPEVPLAQDLVSQLRAEFVGGLALAPRTSCRDAALGHQYLDLLGAFERRHSGHPDLPDVRRQAVRAASGYVWRSFATRGWPSLLRRLITLHPSAVGVLLRTLMRGGARRLGRLASGVVSRRQNASAGWDSRSPM